VLLFYNLLGDSELLTGDWSVVIVVTTGVFLKYVS
jgi:hypothetical protein